MATLGACNRQSDLAAGSCRVRDLADCLQRLELSGTSNLILTGRCLRFPVRIYLTLTTVGLMSRGVRRKDPSPAPDVADALEAAVKRLQRAGAVPEVESRHLRRAAAALELADAADRLARVEIMAARDADNATWEDVGVALGISRQSAHERFRTGPDGMHSRLFMKKAGQASKRTSGSGTSGSALPKARKGV